MPYAMRCRDAAGNIILDVTDRITRLVGTFAVSTANTGSFTDPTLAGKSAWFHPLGSFRAPRITFDASSGTFSWNWETMPATYRSSRTIRYGLY